VGAGSEEDGQVLGKQDPLVEDDLAPRDPPVPRDAPKEIFALADEEIGLRLDAVPGVDPRAVAAERGCSSRRARLARAWRRRRWVTSRRTLLRGVATLAIAARRMALSDEAAAELAPVDILANRSGPETQEVGRLPDRQEPLRGGPVGRWPGGG
jgi:hypothetical protein